MKNHLKKQLNAIKHSLDLLNHEDANNLLSSCIEVINNKNKIVATALGKNVPICEKFIGTLSSIGINSCFMHTNSAIHGDLGVIRDGDLVIILSKSGNTDESIYLYEHLKNRMVDVWLLTCNHESKLLNLIKNKIILDIGDEGDPWNLIPNNSSLAFLFFLQAVSMALIDKLNIKIDEFKKNHPGGNIGKILEKYE